MISTPLNINLMPKDNRLNVLEIIRIVLGDRIIKDDTYACKMCKDDHVYKNILTENYQLLGFKLFGLDNICHTNDFDYYQKYSYDIKDLQKQLGDFLRKEGYAIDHVVLQPCNKKKYWTISFTVKTLLDHPIELKHKNYANCVKHPKLV
jgi:hypothetical protein